MVHEVYRAIVRALRAGRLTEPFSADDFRRACPGFGKGTYSAFPVEAPQGQPRREFRVVRTDSKRDIPRDPAVPLRHLMVGRIFVPSNGEISVAMRHFFSSVLG
jgi:hypothetical protein